MDLKPNSNKYKNEQKAAAEERKIEKVVSGGVKTKKKGGVTKFAEVFISDDVSNVKTYLVQDILLPTVKKAILGALDMILPGGSGFVRSGGSSSSGPKVSYRSFYDDPRDRRGNDKPQARPRFDYDTITYEYRSDAEAVLDQMRDVVERYGLVSVADMYEMARLEQPFTSHKYGWTSVASAEVKRRADGYIIDLPRAMPLD